MKKSILYQEALRLRVEENCSLLEISKKLGIAKSTASEWLKDYPLPDDVLAQKALGKAQGNYIDGRLRPEILANLAKGWSSASRKTLEELKGFPAVRKRILAERGEKCERCGWNQENPYHGKVPVQVNHINGDCTDHRAENLEVLCPNCHALTEHYMFFGRSHSGTWGKKGTRRYR